VLDFDQAYAAIKRRAYGVWPETRAANGGGGILEGEHHAMIAWDREVLPYGAIVIDPNFGTSLSMDALDGRQILEVYYVNFIQGGSTGIRQKLQALIDDLFPNPPAEVIDPDYGQIEDVVSFTTANSLYPNYFFRSRNTMHRAGRVQFKYLVG
jgi:hypothetical protein